MPWHLNIKVCARYLLALIQFLTVCHISGTVSVVLRGKASNEEAQEVSLWCLSNWGWYVIEISFPFIHILISIVHLVLWLVPFQDVHKITDVWSKKENYKMISFVNLDANFFFICCFCQILVSILCISLAFLRKILCKCFLFYVLEQLGHIIP